MLKINLVLLFTLMLISSCKTSKEEDIIRIATLNGPSAISMISLIEEPPLLLGKVKTSFEIMPEPEQVKAGILSEKLDFAILPSTLAAILYNKTGKYILAGIPVWGTMYLVGSDSSINTWKDLENKKVYMMGQGLSPDVIFRYLSEINGLAPGKDYSTDYSFNGHIELANALLAGRAECAVISEPMVSMVLAKNPDLQILIDINREWDRAFPNGPALAQTALIVRKDLAVKQALLVNQFVELYRNSIELLASDPSYCAELIVKLGILPDQEIALQSIPRSNIRFAYTDDVKEEVEDYFKVFLKFNPLIIGSRLPDEEFYYKKEDL